MDPSVLTVYDCPFIKIRLGKSNDGGYVVADIPSVKYSILLSGGISDDISFEEFFINKYNVPCIAFDGTVNALPRKNVGIKFIKKNIGNHNSKIVQPLCRYNSRIRFIRSNVDLKTVIHFTNLHSIIDNYNNIFIKMDIEGGEIPWIKSLNDEQMNKFSQIVVEFHSPYSDNEADVFEKLNKNHVLIHFHGNNYAGVRLYKGLVIPNVFECTYIHKKFFTLPPRLNTQCIPTPLDMKNTLSKEDISLNYPPFVN